MSRILLAVLCTLSFARLLHADSWAGPKINEVFSRSRSYFVRVIPGESIGDTVGFAGSPKGKYAQAEIYQREDDRSYRLVAETRLLNPVAPVDLFVSEDGRFVTLDNWHNVGYGAVVALYASDGKPIESYRLSDLFSQEAIDAFPHSVSSIHWRDKPAYIREDERTFYVGLGNGAELIFDLTSGSYQHCETRDGSYRCRASTAKEGQ